MVTLVPRSNSFVESGADTVVLSGGSSVMINNYIHAKVGIVDDLWAIVGSSNLDGVSLLTPEILRFSARNSPTDYSELEKAGETRSTEICVSVSDQSFATNLRQKLFKDHLGSDLSSPDGKWRGIWENSAAQKLAGLKTAPKVPMPCTVLAWPRTSEGRPTRIANNRYVSSLHMFPAPDAFLSAHGVDIKAVGLRGRLQPFDWNKKVWK